jgi:phospholipid/cholesterol/gamma-HCH transport system substrate-binding protein
MRASSGVVRLVTVGAVIAVIAVAAWLLFSGGGGGDYTVTARFQNAAQLVKGNLVQIGGTKAGSVKDIGVTSDGQAEIKLSIDETHAPLRRGTSATIRQASLSGIANRYVDLQLPPGDKDDTGEIEDGGEIGVDKTETAVELDQLFNTLDPPTRKALQDFFKGGAKQYAGKGGDQANRGYHYLNPALSTASRLFNELNRDTPLLERFIVDSETLVSALAERRDDLAGLIGNLNDTTRALGADKEALAEVIGRLPGFMRRSNTTFVNLRATLDDVDPLVTASKPVAKKLKPFLPELRVFARDARPTVRDLQLTIQRKGADNDLIELTNSFPALAEIATETKERSESPGNHPVGVGETRGAFPEMAQALKDSAPIIGFGRPYTPDLMGWFDDFSTTGYYDALGGYGRAQVVFNALNITGGSPPADLPFLDPIDRGEVFKRFAKIDQWKRCPGGAEMAARDGSNVFSEEEQKALDCKEEDRAPGP